MYKYTDNVEQINTVGTLGNSCLCRYWLAKRTREREGEGEKMHAERDREPPITWPIAYLDT